MISPEDDSARFYQGSESQVIGPERVSDPAHAVHAVSLDGDHVETHLERRIAAFAPKKHCGSVHDLALFAKVDRIGGPCKFSGSSAPHFDKSQASSVEHDQVDFAAATAKIARNRAQALVDQEAIRNIFAAVT
jgi:hypothetical protein